MNVNNNSFTGPLIIGTFDKRAPTRPKGLTHIKGPESQSFNFQHQKWQLHVLDREVLTRRKHSFCNLQKST